MQLLTYDWHFCRGGRGPVAGIPGLYLWVPPGSLCSNDSWSWIHGEEMPTLGTKRFGRMLSKTYVVLIRVLCDNGHHVYKLNKSATRWQIANHVHMDHFGLPGVDEQGAFNVGLFLKRNSDMLLVNRTYHFINSKTLQSWLRVTCWVAGVPAHILTNDSYVQWT